MKINVESHVHLELKFETKSELFAVMNSLIPDNIDCPDGLVVEMYDKHNCLVFDISCKREIFVIMRYSRRNSEAHCNGKTGNFQCLMPSS